MRFTSPILLALATTSTFALPIISHAPSSGTTIFPAAQPILHRRNAESDATAISSSSSDSDTAWKRSGVHMMAATREENVDTEISVSPSTAWRKRSDGSEDVDEVTGEERRATAWKRSSSPSVKEGVAWKRWADRHVAAWKRAAEKSVTAWRKRGLRGLVPGKQYATAWK